ncbi:MAG: TSUP family transporter [Solirubrobacteraceae bacterium]|nr:TSUP family transporter [Solirubrobacteraceae bacterium]
MSAPDVLLVVATLVGVAVQASVGFGFSFFVAPVAVATLDPEQAVMLLLLLGVAVNLLVLAGERRRPDPDRRSVATLLAWSLPALVLGALVVRGLSGPGTQVLVGVGVVVAALLARVDRPVRPRPSRWRLPLSGLTAGTLTTSTSLNGPAVAVGLLGLPLDRERLRDSIAATFIGLSVLGAVALVLLAGQERSLPPAGPLLTTLPAVVVGHRVGRAAFGRLDDADHRRWIVIAALVAGAGSAVAGLAGL